MIRFGYSIEKGYINSPEAVVYLQEGIDKKINGTGYQIKIVDYFESHYSDSKIPCTELTIETNSPFILTTSGIIENVFKKRKRWIKNK